MSVLRKRFDSMVEYRKIDKRIKELQNKEVLTHLEKRLLGALTLKYNRMKMGLDSDR